jgi:periplasmic protein TonB
MEEGNQRCSEPPVVDRARVSDDDPMTRFFSGSFEEKPVWADLYEGLRERMHPPKLPPLELTSTPIPTPDRMAVKTNPWAIGTATALNGCVLVIFILLGVGSTIRHDPQPNPIGNIHLSDFTLFAPSHAPAAGGGGGGSNQLIDPIAGRTPKQEMILTTPPQIPLIEHPKLAMDPAIAVPLTIKLPDDASLPNIGVRNSANVTLASNGPGVHAGIGTGDGGGDGPGKGPGYGPGSYGGTGGSIYRAGIGGVSNPIPIVTPEAEFSDEARRNKYQGVCIISVIVDSHGYPQNLRVVRSLGMGLDEKALAAVKGYRFKPARKDGKPVPVMIEVEVNFRLF